jgi:hypothetical protein
MPWIERPNAKTKLRNDVIMLGLVWGLLSALVVLLLLIGIVLATPVKLAFTMRTSPEWRLLVVARLLGGLTPAIAIHDSEHQQQREKAPRAKKKKKTTRPHRRSGRIPRAMTAAPQLLSGLLRLIHLERLAIDADIGLADPADTGQLYGMLAAANHACSRPPSVSIVVRPDFSGARTSGELDASLSFVPLLLIPPGVRFAWRVFGPRR